jgi:D-3-phosphoglycerate dehydrogenase
VNEADVLESLRSGQIGYAADVIADEFGHLRDSDLIWAAKDEGLNIIITPHIGGMTTEAQEIAYNGVISILEKKLCVK